MAAQFLNSVRVLFNEGCEDRFIAAAEEWVAPEGMLDACGAKKADRLFGFVVFGDRGEAHCRKASDDLASKFRP
mgnify:CR=1 FL=1